MSRKTFMLSALILISISLILAGKPANVLAAENTTICKGVFIDEVDVGGMTKEQAKEAIEGYINELKAKGVAIVVGENIVYTTMGDLGYMTDSDSVIIDALNLGETGNLIKRYKDIKDIEHGSFVLPLSFSYDETKITDIITKDVSVYNMEPVNATVAITDGQLVYTDHVMGSKVNIEKTTEAITSAIDSWDHQDLVIDAVVEEDVPKYTRDIVEKCNTILGDFTTDYSSSAWGRSANLANGARLINNAVLYPGDVFSAYEYLAPFTQENGYEVAGAYLKGKVIDSVGGGACQVTTTLYNAVLEAELEVTERQPHSMTISYVDLSRDAAIAGTSKDFKFTNNTEVPILIQAVAKNKTITFKIWGNETRDTENRKIVFESEVISKTNPPADIITEDPTKPTTYKDVTTPAHTGYKAKLWKVVYENGVQVEKTLVNSSNYQAAAKCVTIGTKVVEEENVEKDKKDKKDKEEIIDNTDNDEIIDYDEVIDIEDGEDNVEEE